MYRWYEGQDIQFDDPQANATATLLLTALLTPQASPATAMGFSLSDKPGGKPKIHKLFPKDMKGKIHPVPQGALLPDHSGMMIPNKALFEKIYKQQIMFGTKGQQFKKFGKWLS